MIVIICKTQCMQNLYFHRLTNPDLEVKFHADTDKPIFVGHENQAPFTICYIVLKRKIRRRLTKLRANDLKKRTKKQLIALCQKLQRSVNKTKVLGKKNKIQMSIVATRTGRTKPKSRKRKRSSTPKVNLRIPKRRRKSKAKRRFF